MARRRIPPFETEITGLDDRGMGVGTGPSGEHVVVRGAPPGSRVAVVPFRRKRATLHARRHALIRPPAAWVDPPCPRFGVCGGCTLQELSLDAQREAKHQAVLDVVGPAPTVHPVRGAPQATRYRNKVELGFGSARYVPEGRYEKGVTVLDGRFLGFHAPGRFDRVVDSDVCHLISEDAERLLQAARGVALTEDAPAPWNAREHTGVLRHLVLREGFRTGERLAILHTTSAADPAFFDRFADALLAAPADHGRLVGVVHRIHDGVSDVATGPMVAVRGQDHLHETLLGRTFRLSPDSFFQTSVEGAEVLYTTIAEALGRGGTLLDLYCGAGSIGIALSEHHDRIVGVEIVPEAVEDARRNAAANGVHGTWVTAKMEDATGVLDEVSGPRRIVVDPPRAGLHPKAAKALAATQADVLVYVACKPSSLGRDRAILEEGGWRATDLWTVDLFPQTGHTEAVMRFVKDPA